MTDTVRPRRLRPPPTAAAANCVQRGHQHALETYPQFVALSLIGGLRHPITTALAGIVWTIARLRWAEGYATGDPDKRYAQVGAPRRLVFLTGNVPAGPSS